MRRLLKCKKRTIAGREYAPDTTHGYLCSLVRRTTLGYYGCLTDFEELLSSRNVRLPPLVREVRNWTTSL